MDEVYTPPCISRRFDTSIVWQNLLVALTKQTLFVDNHNPTKGEHWSMKETQAPILYHMSLFLNENNHLCQEGETFEDGILISQAWCLADIDSTEWNQMRSFSTGQWKIIGTLPAKIISSMVKASKGNLKNE